MSDATLGQLLRSASGTRLGRLDAQLLLLHALGRAGTDRSWLLAHSEDAADATTQERFAAYCERRASEEPLAYITGHKEFFGLDLLVDRRVLVPRPETETLVEWALELLSRHCGPGSCHPGLDRESMEARSDVAWTPGQARDDEARHPCVLDLGTGSGAIALAIQHAFPSAHVRAVDASADALEVARANAKRLGLSIEFILGDWLEAVAGRFDLVLSNPPYVAAGDAHLAALSHEPAQALVSGSDGLDAIRRIVRDAPSHLHDAGWLLLEHGHDQAAQVRVSLAERGFTEIATRKDLAGIGRCTGGKLPARG